ncbi:MAG: hypothetical protein U1F34_03100 [Gammaproteobacteria bacterium]
MTAPASTANQSPIAISLHAPAARDWSELFAALTERLPTLRRALGHADAVAISLQIPALAAFELYDPAILAQLRSLLEDNNFQVYSLDGRHFGERGAPSDDRWGACFPDWRDMRRMAYTNVLADILAELLPDDASGSISTVAIGNRKAVAAEDLPGAARNVLRFAAYLSSLRNSTGKTISLALQPAPCCVLETTSEVVRFFRDYLYSAIANAHFSSAAGVAASEAEALLREHLGVCLDSSYMSCMYDTPAAGIQELLGARIPINKMVLANALITNDAALTRLLPGNRALADCAVTHRADGTLECFTDMQSAFGGLVDAAVARHEWRIACHAPLSQAAVEPFATSQAATRELIDAQASKPCAALLEVNVDSLTDGRELPVARVVREFLWVHEALGQATQAGTRGTPNRPRRRRYPRLASIGSAF